MSRKGIYMIPPEKEVKNAIYGILEDYGMVASLSALTKMVNMRLSSENPMWRVSSRRIKRYAASMRRVRMDISTSERGDIVKKPSCMVCSSEMKPVMNRTLDGDTVVLGYRCPVCGYRTGLKRTVPVRYSFRLR